MADPNAADSKTIVSGSNDDPNKSTQQPGDVIASRYEIVREIGKGGMGVVFLAQDRKLNRFIAIKRLVMSSSNQMHDQRRFLREAQTIASLGHAYIVNIYDIGQDDLGYYITMEYIAGPAIGDTAMRSSPPAPVTLDDYLTEKGPFEPEAAVDFLLKVCSAVEYAHLQSIIHRDIKPTNVLLTDRFEPKLVDFGLARSVAPSYSEAITLQGQFVGTPEYVAPEQWSSSEVDNRADVYALGAILWYMLTGKIPRFFRESDCPESLRKVLSKALAPKPTDRFQTARELADSLEDLGSEPKTTKPANEAEPTDGRWPCPTCEKFSPDEARYCVHCGTCGMINCPICEGEMRHDTQFCPHCGTDIKSSEEALGSLQEAKSQASFLEYESALATIKDLVDSHNSEAMKLANEWRKLVLERRNLLTDLDSCIRVFNLDKAVEHQQQVKKMIPVECLSESADFEAVIKHSSLISELKQLLQDAAARAREDSNLEKFSHQIRLLNQVFGDEACMTINKELTDIEIALDNAVTQAGLAIGMNCLSYGMELLESTENWHSGALGARRTSAVKHCSTLLKEREQAIDDIEAAVREGQFGDALKLVRRTATFRLPPNNSEMRPAKADLEAHERIMKIDRVLTSKIQDTVPEWVEKDEWEAVVQALETLKIGDHPTWRRLEESVRSRVNREIAKRYNKAIEIERKGRLAQAERAWQLFTQIPPQLVTANLWQYACDFSRRKQTTLRARRDKIIRRTVILTLMAWVFAICQAVLPPFQVLAKLDNMRAIGPGIANFVLYLMTLLALRSKRVVNFEKQVDVDEAPARIYILCAALALSPLGSTLYYLLVRELPEYASTPISNFPLTAITILWLLADLLRQNGFKMPGAFSLTLSWVVAAGIFHLAKLVPSMPANESWPALAMAHWLIFVILQLVHCRLHPNEAKAKLQAQQSNITKTETGVRHQADLQGGTEPSA